MQDDMVAVWNVSSMVDSDIELSNRTSNGLERYNRHMKEIFPHAHPSLVVFASVLEKEVEEVIQRIEDVKKGREAPPTLTGANFPDIPEDFEDFMPLAFGKRGKGRKAGRKGKKN